MKHLISIAALVLWLTGLTLVAACGGTEDQGSFQPGCTGDDCADAKDTSGGGDVSPDGAEVAPLCIDQCSDMNALRCDTDTTVVTCGDYDPDNCLEWSAPVACGSGLVCSNGHCALTCTAECTTVGAKQCLGNVVRPAETTTTTVASSGELTRTVAG